MKILLSSLQKKKHRSPSACRRVGAKPVMLRRAQHERLECRRICLLYYGLINIAAKLIRQVTAVAKFPGCPFVNLHGHGIDDDTVSLPGPFKADIALHDIA
jgi:hypothetical protein